jgi:hypothetical protein
MDEQAKQRMEVKKQNRLYMDDARAARSCYNGAEEPGTDGNVTVNMSSR